jgi:hypothetical protein
LIVSLGFSADCSTVIEWKAPDEDLDSDTRRS